MKETLIDQLLEEARQTKNVTGKLEQIDAAAIELFAKKGFANTSTSEIAKLAGVAEGTIFRHYKTKDKLLSSILLKFMKQLIPTMKRDLLRALKSQEFETFSDFLTFFVRNRLELVKNNPETFKIFIKEIVYHDQLRRQLLEINDSMVEEVFFDIFNRFKVKGELRELSNDVLFRHIIKSILSQFVFTFLIVGVEPVDEDRWVEELVELTIHGIV